MGRGVQGTTVISAKHPSCVHVATNMRLMPGAHYIQLALTVIKVDKNYANVFHTEHETGIVVEKKK